MLNSHEFSYLEGRVSHDMDTAPVRSGEELPVAALQAYLTERMPGASGPLTIEQFPHGHSNLTYLLRMGDQEFVLRRPPFGNVIKTAHDMGREFRVLSKLSAVFPPAPRPYFYCDDTSILGVPFYVMERRRGVVLRHADHTLDPPTARRLSEALIDNLARQPQPTGTGHSLQRQDRPRRLRNALLLLLRALQDRGHHPADLRPLRPRTYPGRTLRPSERTCRGARPDGNSGRGDGAVL